MTIDQDTDPPAVSTPAPVGPPPPGGGRVPHCDPSLRYDHHYLRDGDARRWRCRNCGRTKPFHTDGDLAPDPTAEAGE